MQRQGVVKQMRVQQQQRRRERRGRSVMTWELMRDL
jgi:hypothetical protein